MPKSGIKMKGAALLEHALENTSPYFSYTIGVKAMSADPCCRIMMLYSWATRKIESIRSRFEEWLRELPGPEKQNTIEELI